MISATVSEFQFIGFGTVSQGYNLMTKANTENRVFTEQVLNRLDGLGYIGRIAGAVGNKDAVGIKCHNRFFRSIPRYDRYLAATLI